MEDRKDLRYVLNNLPHSKTLLFVEYYFKASELEQKKVKNKPFTISKYGQKEYIQLLKRSLTKQELQNELIKMSSRTSWEVNSIMINFALELRDIINYYNN